MGVDHTQHDAKGLPTIDAAFPDTGAMVKQIHAKGLSAGWYLNGCKCGEHVEKPANYEGDIADLHKFDVKWWHFLDLLAVRLANPKSITISVRWCQDRWVRPSAEPDLLRATDGRVGEELHHRELSLGRLHQLRRQLLPDAGLVPLQL